ncbi:nucleotidyltransferase family protein [Kutzneria sp. CA-103260]|uniref:nucleotidyltransferase family protein n=1 Tax=Kutzneria sp. CA-103260 TaxID=2802641 RepID=UPI001BAD1047|nr:nucleotidyltransferase family protein [Kutzneria sp. CA-103260]QUQ64979.1 putative nucleotidyltransferase [Kutzneria sp. CA-103260]
MDGHESRTDEKVWELLEHISISDPDNEPFEKAVQLAPLIDDPDELLAQAARHALVPSLADFLVRADLLRLVPHHAQRHLLGTLHWNRFKTRRHAHEAERITTVLASEGVRVACTKGVVCQQTLYDGRGIRHFGDIDLMVLPEHREKAAEVLYRLGYAGATKFDHRTGELLEISRSLQLMYQLYPDHLPHFFRIPADDDGMPYFMVDVAYNLTWYGSSWQIPMDRALDNVVGVDSGSVTLPALDVPYGFIFVVLHLFREGWFERTVREKDVRLGQCADVWRFWERFGRDRVDDIRKVLAEYGLEPAIAWVCRHVDDVYRGTITGELGLDEYCDDGWLHSAGATDGGYLVWQGSLRDRLRDRRPPVLRPGGEPSFAAAARVSPA